MATLDLDKVGKNTLKNADTGESVQVQSLWQEHTVVLFFLRRFGCQVCRWTASEVSKLDPELRANGIALVGVGPEETGLKEFREGGYFKGELYIDETKTCYKELGFKRYSALGIIPAGLGKKVRDVASQARSQGIQGNFTGDLLQSGGMLVVSRGGDNVLLHFVQDSPGDYVQLDDLCKVLGVSLNAQAGQKPTCNDDVCAH